MDPHPELQVQGGRKTDRFGVDVEVVLIVVYVPEGRVASVRDVACGRTFRGYGISAQK